MDIGPKARFDISNQVALCDLVLFFDQGLARGTEMLIEQDLDFFRYR